MIHTTMLPALMFFRAAVSVPPLSAATGDTAFAVSASADGGSGRETRGVGRGA